MVMGYGVTGKSVVSFLKEKTSFQIIVCNSGETSSWGNDALSGIETFDLENTDLFNEYLKKSPFVMRSPGIDPRPFLSTDLEKKEIGEIELASQFLSKMKANEDQADPAGLKILALTGTNGKTTTVSLIEHVLKNAGYKVFLGGNVGTPWIEMFLTEEWRNFQVVILELSSFQTEQLKTFHCDSSAILNLSSSHEERYDNVDDYFSAKIDLFNHGLLANNFFLKFDLDKIQRIQPKLNLSLQNGVHLNLDIAKQLEASLDIIGDHNVLNACFSYQMITSVGLKVEFKHFSGFHGVRFRLQKIKSQTIEVYNDAKSTNQESTFTAIQSMQKHHDHFHLIMGGQLRNKKIEFNDLFKILDSKISLHFFGESAEQLCEHAKKFNLNSFQYTNLNEALRAIKASKKEKAILFSPGFPSFDQFKNYIDRGNQFNEIINQLGL